MRSRILQLPSRVKRRTRIAIAVTGFVLVHIAAYFLFTATAPYMGAFLGILGLAFFILGSNKPIQKPPKKKSKEKSIGRKYYYFEA